MSRPPKSTDLLEPPRGAGRVHGNEDALCDHGDVTVWGGELGKGLCLLLRKFTIFDIKMPTQPTIQYTMQKKS